MPAGKRDQRISIQQKTVASDSMGGSTSSGWTNVHAIVMAGFDLMSGREALDAAQPQARTMYRVTIPNLRNITAAMRIKWLSASDQILNIRDLQDPGSRPTERTLIAEIGGTETP